MPCDGFTESPVPPETPTQTSNETPAQIILFANVLFGISIFSINENKRTHY